MSIKRADSFISKLLEETYQSLPASEVARSSMDLHEYFISKVAPVTDEIDEGDKFIKESGLSYYSFVYNPHSQCFRLKINDYLFDFPINWSVFSKILEQKWIEIDQSNDDDMLLQAIASIVPSRPTKLALALNATGGGYVILGQNSQELIFRNLRNVFSSTKDKIPKAA